MNKMELELVADELRRNVNNRFDSALLTLVETFADMAGNPPVDYSCGAVNIRVTHDGIILTNRKTNQTILTFSANLAQDTHYEKIARLVMFGRQIWLSLSEDERACYYDDSGTLGFVDDVMKILHIHENEIESLQEFERIHWLITVGDLSYDN